MEVVDISVSDEAEKQVVRLSLLANGANHRVIKTSEYVDGRPALHWSIQVALAISDVEGGCQPWTKERAEMFDHVHRQIKAKCPELF